MNTMMNQIGRSIDGASDTGQSRTAPLATSRDELGQKDFLTLMAAQLQNQDPFAPMENGEFLGQMAQFSTVQGLDTVNETLAGISSQIAMQKLTTGSSLMGQQILVPGTVARPDHEGEIHGMVDLSQAANAVSVQYLDAETGELLHQQSLGAQGAGQLPISWTNLPPDLAASRDGVRIAVQTDSPEPATTSVYARVTGVQMPAGAQDMTLNLEDYGVLSSLEITSIR